MARWNGVQDYKFDPNKYIALETKERFFCLFNHLREDKRKNMLCSIDIKAKLIFQSMYFILQAKRIRHQMNIISDYKTE